MASDVKNEKPEELAKHVKTLKDGNESLAETLQFYRPKLTQLFDDLEKALSPATMTGPK